jgi:hypothetical protein
LIDSKIGNILEVFKPNAQMGTKDSRIRVGRSRESGIGPAVSGRKKEFCENDRGDLAEFVFVCEAVYDRAHR